MERDQAPRRLLSRLVFGALGRRGHCESVRRSGRVAKREMSPQEECEARREEGPAAAWILGHDIRHAIRRPRPI